MNCVNVHTSQECIPVGCVPPDRYRTGGTEGQRTPLDKNPLNRCRGFAVSLTETLTDREPPCRDPLLMSVDKHPLDRKETPFNKYLLNRDSK